MNFQDSVLMISARSPFSRRVRLAFREHGIAYEERVFDVFKPVPELTSLNPLSRVPTVRLANGGILTESEKILHAFYATQPDSAWIPRTDFERISADFWSGVSVGLCEKVIEFYLESLRPQSARDRELLAEIREISERVLERFEGFIERRATIVPDRMTQADLDMGTALVYFDLRYGGQLPQWKSRFPQTAAYMQRLEARPSFQATQPPSAV